MKKWLIILGVIILSIIIHQFGQIMMIKSLENVRTDFFDVVKGQKKEGIDYGALIKFDYEEKIKKVDSLEFDIESTFHDNKKGYLYASYKYSIINREDSSSGASGRIKCYVKKKDGRWVVVRFEEQFGAAMDVYEVNEEGDITMSAIEPYWW